MNVYDFDKTILRGDSTTLFLAFLVRRQPSLLRFSPRCLAAWFRYLTGGVNKTAAKQRLFSIFSAVRDMDGAVRDFWEKGKNRVTQRYLLERKDTDVVVSASPRFLIEPICTLLGVQTLIASEVDKKTGVFDGLNCYGEEKVRRFRDVFPDAEVERFYSDSLSDAPMAALAREAFLVKGEQLRPWPGQ
ncbi:MAG: HAD-IB family phosphatase [Eubacteriales bacterium]|nr:HAD-IB family phosphatase [Eubacteriales bacterium]